MIRFQIHAPVALENTPVRIEVPRSLLPSKHIMLRPSSGEPIPAQADGDGIVALLSLPAGGRENYVLEAAPELVAGVVVLKGEAEGQLDISLPETLLGTYHFAEGIPRPFLWPLIGPDGKELTRAYPMENREGEMHDHPHHRSLWSAFDEVNEVNNWHEGEGHGFTCHEEFLEQSSGPVFGGFASRNRWESAQGQPLLNEIRHIRFYNVDGAQRLLDYDIEWRADFGDVAFGDTKEAGSIAVRVATSMDGARGGTIENSLGGRGEKECWGKQANWCDYSGEVDGATYGIAIFNRPESFGGAPRWHVRDYGLFAVNPFSNGSFTGGENTPFTLKQGERVRLAYRVLLHRGDASAANVAGVWEALRQPPQIVVES